MQTFMPYPSFSLSAQCLDPKRLGKQRVETLQILNVLCGKTSGWANHPAVRMWRGYEPALRAYGIAVCREWIARGYKDTCLDKISTMPLPATARPYTRPAWLEDEALLASHRSNLLRKDPHFYARFGWTETPDLPYVWPV